MIIRESNKLEIDDIAEDQLVNLHLFIRVLKQQSTELKAPKTIDSLLENSVVFEGDILSPIDIFWNVEQGSY